MNQAEKAKAFRALHERPGAFLIPNPFDIGTMKILEGLGYEALATTSAGLAFSRGKKDGKATREEVLAHCADLCAASRLPISADLGIGFGESPESAAETVRAAADAGLSGCSLEDTPQDGKGVALDFALAVERIAAAAEAARALPHDFLLTARTEHLFYGGTDLDEVIHRLQAFEAAGADVLFAPGIGDTGTARTVCAAVTRPVNVLIETRGAPLSFPELEEAGAKRISVGAMLARTAYGAVIRAMRGLGETGAVPAWTHEVRGPEIAAFFD